MYRYVIVGKDKGEIETEVMYAVATARSLSEELLVLNCGEYDSYDRTKMLALKTLKNMKKQGKVQLFVGAADVNGASTEVKYLENKYPKFTSMLDEADIALIKL